MHSITARSLSKEFREGLRQIPNNLTNSPNSNSNKLNSSNELIEEKKHDNHKHLNGSSEVLKSNVKFWEKLQKQ